MKKEKCSGYCIRMALDEGKELQDTRELSADVFYNMSCFLVLFRFLVFLISCCMIHPSTHKHQSLSCLGDVNFFMHPAAPQRFGTSSDQTKVFHRHIPANQSSTGSELIN